MELERLVIEFVAARRAMMDDVGRDGRSIEAYKAERAEVSDRYAAAALALEQAADHIAARTG